jgi:hypothetical protein
MRRYPGPKRLHPFRSVNHSTLRGLCNTTRDQVALAQSRILARDRFWFGSRFSRVCFRPRGVASVKSPFIPGMRCISPGSVASSRVRATHVFLLFREVFTRVGWKRASRGCFTRSPGSSSSGHLGSPTGPLRRRNNVVRAFGWSKIQTFGCDASFDAMRSLGNPPREGRDPGLNRGAFSPSV